MAIKTIKLKKKITKAQETSKHSSVKYEGSQGRGARIFFTLLSCKSKNEESISEYFRFINPKRNSPACYRSQRSSSADKRCKSRTI